MRHRHHAHAMRRCSARQSQARRSADDGQAATTYPRQRPIAHTTQAGHRRPDEADPVPLTATARMRGLE